VWQEAAAAKQELVSLQTTVDTLHEQFNLLQIEKETEVDALTKQVLYTTWNENICLQKYDQDIRNPSFLSEENGVVLRSSCSIRLVLFFNQLT
jgi:hypothetical protein